MSSRAPRLPRRTPLRRRSRVEWSYASLRDMKSFAKESAMLRRRFASTFGPVALLLISLTGAIRAERPVPLALLQFLFGEWEGIGDQAGATGGFTFAPSVQDRVIVRTNYSNTPPGVGKLG